MTLQVRGPLLPVQPLPPLMPIWSFLCPATPALPAQLCADSLALFEHEPAGAPIDRNRVALAKSALQDAKRKRIQHAALNGTLERPRSVGGIVPFADQILFGRVR